MVDILVIGAGIAGLSSAIGAKESGSRVLVASKALATSSQSSMAQGGMNVALGNVQEDKVELHIEDTLKSAHGLADKEMVTKMCQNGVDAIAFLEKIGVPFSRIDGAKSAIKSIAQRKLGGASRIRACYAQDYTGLKILHTMYDYALKLGVEFNSGLYLLDLMADNGKVCGAVFLDIATSEIKKIYAKSVVLATGGYGGIYYGHTTNMHSSTGDGLGAILRAGGVTSGMEFVQFHPTALKSSSVLISESARGEGGYLVNSDGERFVDELKPRDEVARAIFEQINSGKDVFLDLRHLGADKIMKLMPQEAHLAKFYEGVDISKELVPIKSVAHYSMGGALVDKSFRVKGLDNCLAVGEVSNARVHGANRLGGNSLLEVVTFGLEAGRVASKLENSQSKDFDYNFNLPFEADEINIYNLKRELGDLMYKKAGIIRNKEDLQSLSADIEKISLLVKNGAIRDRSKEYNQELIEYLELKNALLVAKYIAKGALLREESRGAHFRSDYPKESLEFAKDIELRVEQ